jgi:hypothetical protein
MEVTRRWYLSAVSAVGISGPHRLWLPAKRPASEYAPDYFAFEGDTYLTRDQPLNGAVDSRSGAFVFKAQPPPVRNGVVHEYWCSANGRVRLIRDTANRVAMMLTDGPHAFRFRTQSTFKAGDDDAVFLISFDTGRPAGGKIGRIYKNGVLDSEVAADDGPPFDVRFSEPGWAFGSTVTGANRLTGMLTEFMMFAGESIDWSAPATLAQIYQEGALIEPGDHGQNITGRPPLVYCTIRTDEPPSAFLKNRGTGGDFAVKKGAAVKRSRAQLDYGDSFTAGALATGLPFTSAAFLQSRLYSPPRYNLNRGIGGQPLSDPGSGPSTCISGRFLTDLPNNIAIYTDRVWRLQGGYNDRLVTLAHIVKAARSMRDALLAADPTARYYFIGVCNGGQRKSGNNIQPDEEYRGGALYRKIIDINGGLADVLGKHFYDVRSDLITHGLKWAAAGGFASTTPEEDAFDIAHDVVPTGLRAVSAVDGSPIRRYGIHLNNAGHYAHAVGEQIFRTGLGYD